MRWLKNLKESLAGLTEAIARFPLTTLFLLAAAVVNSYGISSDKDMSVYLLTFVVGAFLGAAFQVAYERYFSKFTARLALMVAVALLTMGYYLIIKQASTMSMEIEIRTAVALFALLIAFIWIPVLRSEISFNKSFMITFKSLFNSLFFSAVIFGGLAIILSAFDLLISDISSNAYLHTANIVFVIFAPMYFLSLIPVFPGASTAGEKESRLEKIEKAGFIPKFLEILISYILIPLIAVFTLILVFYILKNIGGEFWTDNLLEPMLVTYAITVILVYILASEIDNKFTVFFRKVFPKVLVPIVIFQIAASVLSLADTGVTHTRYFVIIFGIFAAIAGVLLSFLPVRKNGVIAALLIVFSAVSIVPPVDAFTVSRASQINMLEDVLEKNNMLEDGRVKPKEAVPAEDRQKIIDTIEYLSAMGYTKHVDWLPEPFQIQTDFKRVFGFHPYETGGMDQPVYLRIDPADPIDIAGFDTLLRVYITSNDSAESYNFKVGGKNYVLSKEAGDGGVILKLAGENNEELLNFEIKQIFDKYRDYDGGLKELLSIEEATVTSENELAKITAIVQQVTIEKTQPEYYSADLYVLIQIK